jgi:hypothetical protein
LTEPVAAPGERLPPPEAGLADDEVPGREKLIGVLHVGEQHPIERLSALADDVAASTAPVGIAVSGNPVPALTTTTINITVAGSSLVGQGGNTGTVRQTLGTSGLQCKAPVATIRSFLGGRLRHRTPQRGGFMRSSAVRL